nr:tetratricopeptide repeat protein [Desulfobacterales bacterium]
MKSSLSTYSQHKEDLVIDALLSHKRHGFYVNIGENDPDATNNSKLFYNRGWHGINIETEPIPFARLCARRERDLNLNIGIEPDAGTMTFYRMSAENLSSFNKQAATQAGKVYGEGLIPEQPPPALGLVDIFESQLRGMTIDFMSIDAKDYDLNLLKSNDWNRFRPSLMIVKNNVKGDTIIQFLQQHDYIMVFDNRTNGIFISKEFSTALDQCVRKDLIQLEQTYNLKTIIPHTTDKEKLLHYHEKAVQLEPDNIIALKNLADFYYVEEGRVENALKIYVDILAKEPENLEILLIIGHICVSLQKFEDAKVFYNRVFEIEPQNQDAHQNLDKIISNELSGISDQITKSHIISGTNILKAKSPEEIYQNIQPLIKKEQFDKAIEKLEELLEYHPGFSLAHNDLGVLH